MSYQGERPRLPARIEPDRTLAMAPQSRLPVLAEERDALAAGVQNYLHLFARRKATIVISLVGILALAVLATALTPRTYEATAVLLVSEVPKVEERPSQSPGVPVLALQGSPNLDTHVQLLLGESTAADTAEWLRAHDGPQFTAEALRPRIRAQAVRDTQLIRISALAGTAAEAQTIANAAASSYVAANRQRARGSSESAGRYLKEQLVDARQTLTKAQNALRAFRESTGTVTADAQASQLVGQVAGLRGDADKAEADLAQAQQRLSKLNSQLAQANATIGSGLVRNDAVIQKLRDRLADLESQKLEAQAKYTQAYPEPVARLDEQIATVRKQLGDEIRQVVRGNSGDLSLQQTLTSKMIETQAEVAATQARHRQVLAELAQAESRLTGIPGRQLALANLQRDEDVASGIYADLLKRAQEVEVGRVMALGNAEVAEAATKPLFPVKPNILLNLTVGLLLGLGVGLGLALIQDQLDDSVRDQAEAARLADAPILGTIPVFDRPTDAVLGPVNGAHSTALEAYRALRYCLDFITPGERGRVVLVTSAGPAEGKSTTVLNLAMAVALTGRRVLLIDTDLRRSALHRMLEVEEAKGITDLLAGEAELAEVLQRNPKTGLMFIASGKQVPNPTELLESKAMRELLETLRGEADLIIFDSPPVLSVADTLVLASLADTVLMVCVAGQSHRYDMQLARQLLSHVGERIGGVVLNKVGHKAGYTYHDRYYYY